MDRVPEIMNTALRSLSRCLGYYWPADAEGRNDLVENNLAIHIAHAFLERSYAVIADDVPRILCTAILQIPSCLIVLVPIFKVDILREPIILTGTILG